MKWFMVEAEVTEVKRVNYIVLANNGNDAMDRVESANLKSLVIEQNSETIDHVETVCHTAEEIK